MFYVLILFLPTRVGRWPCHSPSRPISKRTIYSIYCKFTFVKGGGKTQGGVTFPLLAFLLSARVVVFAHRAPSSRCLLRHARWSGGGHAPRLHTALVGCTFPHMAKRPESTYLLRCSLWSRRPRPIATTSCGTMLLPSIRSRVLRWETGPLTS